jgi:hypothetical protein
MTGDRKLGSLILESERLASEGDWGPSALAVNGDLAALAPRASGVRYRLALCLEEAKQYEKALAEFEHVLALSSTESELTRKTQPWIDGLRARIDARASTSFHDTRALRSSCGIKEESKRH